MNISKEYKDYISKYLLDNFIRYDSKSLFNNGFSIVENNYVYIIQSLNNINILNIEANNYYVLFIDYKLYDNIYNDIPDKFFNNNVDIVTDYFKLLELRYPEYIIIKYLNRSNNTKPIKIFINSLNSKNLYLILFDSVSYKTYINNFNLAKRVVLDINNIYTFRFKVKKINPKDCKYNKEDLPLIKFYDPLCYLYRFEKGDIIKIMRNDGVYYRLVI